MSSNNGDPVELAFADGGAVNSRKGVWRRVILRVGGEDRDAVSLKLDSDQARDRQAQRWAAGFGLDLALLAGKLRQCAVVATAESQQANNSQRVGGTISPPTPPRTLTEAREVFDRWLEDTDPDLLDVVLGAVMAHRIEGDPLWLFVIGPPGDGKTELLRSLSAHSGVYPLSTLTPRSLISGCITEGPDPSLIPKLDGKVLVVKDFTSVLQMPNEARAEVMGALRDAYDGECGKAFGTGEVKKYRSRFGLIAAVTPAIDNHWAVNQQLGERFLRFRLRETRRQNKVRKAIGNVSTEAAMREELSAAAAGVLSQPTRSVSISQHLQERLIALADFVALARSGVSRDRRGVVEFVPSPEVGTRVSKALKKLLIGTCVARGQDTVDDDIFRIAVRVGEDTIPSMRSRLLRILWDHRSGWVSTATIGEAGDLATDTAKSWLDDLRLLGIVDRQGEGRGVAHEWRLREEFQRTVEAAGLYGDRVPPDSVPPGSGDAMGVPPDFAPLASSQSEVKGAISPPTSVGEHQADLIDDGGDDWEGDSTAWATDR